MNIGAHVSIQGGVTHAFDEIREIGGTCGQIFTHSPRTWRFPELDDEEAARFKEIYRKKEIWPILIHESYLTNLATPKEDIYKKSMETMEKEIAAAKALGIEYIKIHPGSHLGQGEDKGLLQIATSLNNLEPDMEEVIILLETTAGKGTDLGYTFQQLQHLRDLINCETGICLDTCHVFAAGYDITTREGLDRTMNQVDSTVGISNLRAVQLNDSKYPFNSRKDEHAHIGLGEIGEEGFRVFVNHPAIRDLPLILETPVDATRGHRQNLETVRSLVTS
ncbi:MAG: deoxyribonuclease IV [Theionarchaea archaeon]|nr:deoxyribonuclease IV [Theionarchaea archaeon]MBU7036869.1 deoxyribonuclease IV [Theionarchaea archaeon]